MSVMLPTHTKPTRYHRPHHPSPLSSSPLRNSPSPLKERNININVPQSTFSRDYIMSSPPRPSKSIFGGDSSPIRIKTPMSPPPSRSREKENAFSKRVIKSNPLMDRREKTDERETRRKLFLKRVRDSADDKKWRDRNAGMMEGQEEILRAIWVAEERRREDKKRREALGWDIQDEEEEGSTGEALADEITRREEAELEAMLQGLKDEGLDRKESMHIDEDMQYSSQNLATRSHERASENGYDSDDEAYDDIFMDVIQQESRMASQQPFSYVDPDSDMMDMS